MLSQSDLAVRETRQMTASWIIREKETKRVIFETFNAQLIGALNTDKYEAVPVREYLASLNLREAKSLTPPKPAEGN